MSSLYLAPDPRTLADKLADDLDRDTKTGDFFTPTTIVVPNRYVRKWLRLWLARRHGIAINLNFLSLEEALWQLLQETDPAARVSPPEVMDDNTYRLMVLSVLLEEKDPHLAPLRRYVQMDSANLSRLTCRRAWYLADRLGLLIRDYEYDRQDALIQPWLRKQFGLGSASEFHQMMERAQRALFLHITREPDGKRALLNRLGERAFKTLPQYAMERMEQPSSPDRLRDSARRAVHFFGFSHLCALHARTIGWLGRFFDMRLYQLNLRAGDVDGDTRMLREPGNELMRLWGRAAAESLALLAPCAFGVEIPPAHASKRTAASVLSRLRDQLLGEAPAKARLAQDTSLQIVGCPGILREVETVHDSIVFNLQDDPALKQTDIAVLVTDMPKYRAALHAAFERPPRRLQYNMVDFQAAGVSMFGQALLGMLDLALESFSRTRVFQVILNPCFLARLGVDRTQALTWLRWAEELGIYQGWDADEKHEQGYPRSPLYAWRHGLQRLRLGRFMDTASEDADGPAPRFGHVIPFADLESGEREHLDAFCRAVEGLLPALARLRPSAMTGARWASNLHRLALEFLDVPADRPEEMQVREELVAAIAKLDTWDALRDAKQKATAMPLALVREYVQSQLTGLEGSRGDYLVGGVTIAALQPMRALPFAVVYLLGLSEDLFPGSNSLSSFDLRGAVRLAGDIRPAEQRLHDLLATILSAQQKLYLFYNNHDLQKDQPLLPAAPLVQLQRFLSDNVLQSDFEPVSMPAHADDDRYLDPAKQPSYQDVLMQTRDADRCLALDAAAQAHRLALDKKQQAEWERQRREFQVDFAIAPEPATPPTGPSTVTLVELRRFLQLPAQESMRRHLRVDEPFERDSDDDEPLITSEWNVRAMVRQTIQQVILSSAAKGVDQALADWQERFEARYADARLRCRVPEEAFGDIDRASLRADLQERIRGQGRIEEFLRERAGMTFCGPVLLGESLTPMGARLRFPALALPGDEARLVGWTDFAWHAPGRFEVLVVTTGKEFDGREIHYTMIEPALLHLALLANAAPNAEGVASEKWLAQREVMLHVAHAGGVTTWTHPPGSITSAEALAYFANLARDFLDPASFDLLPLDVLLGNKELQLALHADFGTRMSPDDFRSLLEETIADARESTFSQIRIPLFVDMTAAQVPADALAKVQCRFHLLDRGPARLRQQPKITKRKGGPKS